MCSVTVGGPSDSYSSIGAYGPLDPILRPINHGILGFVGFTVVQPFIVHAPARMSQEQRVDCLGAYRSRLLSLATAPVVTCPDMADYEGLVLKPALRPGVA